MVTWFHRIPNLHLCTKFHRNEMIFYGDMMILRFTIWRPSAILDFRNVDFMSRDLYRHVVALPCPKCHWNQTISCELWSKKWFLKWRSYASLNFINFYICSCGCHWVPNLHLCIKFHQNQLWFFVEISWFHDFQDGRSPPSWILGSNNGFFEKPM